MLFSSTIIGSIMLALSLPATANSGNMDNGVQALVDAIAKPLINSGYTVSIDVEHSANMDTSWIELMAPSQQGIYDDQTVLKDECSDMIRIVKTALGIDPDKGIPLSGPTGRVGRIMTGITESTPGIYALSFLVERGIQIDAKLLGVDNKPTIHCASPLLGSQVLVIDLPAE